MCRIGNTEEVCTFASPSSQAAAGKFGFTPQSAHYRPLLGHAAAQVVTTMQTLPNKATVVIGLPLKHLLPDAPLCTAALSHMLPDAPLSTARSATAKDKVGAKPVCLLLRLDYVL